MSLVIGEVVGFLLSPMAGIWPWAACGVVFVSCTAIGWNMPLGRYLVALVLGLALAWRTEEGRLMLERQSRQVGADGSPPSFIVKVEGDVICRRRQYDDGWIVSFMTRVSGIRVKVIALIRRDGAMPAPGETWRCAGWMSLKKSAPSRYARRTLWVMDETRIERISADGGVAVLDAYRRISDKLSLYAGTGLGWSPELASFNRAMLLGRRTEISARHKEVFAEAGTMHVFAISGLHVMMVAGMLRMLLAGIGLSRRACAACAIPLLVAYVMLTGARPSAVRAAFMASLWLGAGLLGRKPDALTSWGNSALAIYGLSPERIFDAGCALSFAVMLGISLWLRWSSQFVTPLDWMLKLAERAAALGEGRRAAALVRWRRWGLHLLAAFGISCAAWIAGAPIMARVFGSIAVGSLVANVVVVPLAGISVVMGAAGMAVSMVVPAVGAMFNNLSALCTWLMVQVSELVVRCPGLFWETLPWSWCDCIIWYVAWMTLFAVLSRHVPRRESVSVKTWELEGSHGTVG